MPCTQKSNLDRVMKNSAINQLIPNSKTFSG